MWDNEVAYSVAGLNIYFWLSFIPAIVGILTLAIISNQSLHNNIFLNNLSMSKLVMLVGTKLQHVVSSLALEIKEQTGPQIGTQVKPRDDLFWFRKPVILLRLIQFIIFQVIISCVVSFKYPSSHPYLTVVLISFIFVQNAFEMATFIWSLVSGYSFFLCGSACL